MKKTANTPKELAEQLLEKKNISVSALVAKGNKSALAYILLDDNKSSEILDNLSNRQKKALLVKLGMDSNAVKNIANNDLDTKIKEQAKSITDKQNTLIEKETNMKEKAQNKYNEAVKFLATLKQLKGAKKMNYNNGTRCLYDPSTGQGVIKKGNKIQIIENYNPADKAAKYTKVVEFDLDKQKFGYNVSGNMIRMQVDSDFKTLEEYVNNMFNS